MVCLYICCKYFLSYDFILIGNLSTGQLNVLYGDRIDYTDYQNEIYAGL